MEITDLLGARCKDAYSTRPVCVVCLGDSVTHGCFEVFINNEGHVDTAYRPELSYSARLQARLRELYPAAAATVIDAGISGDSSAGGLKRLERDVLSFKPDLVIVDFGLNDSMNPDVEGGLASYTANMSAIFDAILASGAKAMLLTPNFMCQYVSHELTDKTLRDIAADAAAVQNGGTLTRYVDAARKVARERDIPVADAYLRYQKMSDAGVDITSLLANYINHPSPELHGVFVEEIIRAIFED